MMKRVLLATAIATALGVIAPATALADVYVRVGPPPVRVEHVPPPRHGWVWEPGHWEWRGHHHVWVAGHWLRERPGYVYSAPRWYERDGGWYYAPGRWGRGDRDRDGIPNRFDRHPDNPYRR